jgi:hypothetical protein
MLASWLLFRSKQDLVLTLNWHQLHDLKVFQRLLSTWNVMIQFLHFNQLFRKVVPIMLYNSQDIHKISGKITKTAILNWLGNESLSERSEKTQLKNVVWSET